MCIRDSPDPDGGADPVHLVLRDQVAEAHAGTGNPSAGLAGCRRAGRIGTRLPAPSLDALLRRREDVVEQGRLSFDSLELWITQPTVEIEIDGLEFTVPFNQQVDWLLAVLSCDDGSA